MESSAANDTTPQLPRVGRLLAIDWGERRIGIALSDPNQTVAHPLGTLTRRVGRRFPLRPLFEYLEEHEPSAILLGLPLEPDGAEGPAARAVRDLGRLLSRKTDLPIGYVDERMTTARVRAAIRETRGKPQDIEMDPLAATVLLQHYLDRVRQ